MFRNNNINIYLSYFKVLTVYLSIEVDEVDSADGVKCTISKWRPRSVRAAER